MLSDKYHHFVLTSRYLILVRRLWHLPDDFLLHLWFPPQAILSFHILFSKKERQSNEKTNNQNKIDIGESKRFKQGIVSLFNYLIRIKLLITIYKSYSLKIMSSLFISGIFAKGCNNWIWRKWMAQNEEGSERRM